MVKHNAQRVPVIDSEGQLVSILTESGVLAFLARNIDCVEQANMTVGQLGLGKAQPQKVKHDQKAIDAFELMWKEHAFGCAVTDDSGAIIAHVSASDLRVIGNSGNLLSTLYLPMSYFIKLASDSGSYAPVCVTPNSTLRELLSELVKRSIHSVYVMEDKKCLGLVTLHDIVRCLKVLHD